MAEQFFFDHFLGISKKYTIPSTMRKLVLKELFQILIFKKHVWIIFIVQPIRAYIYQVITFAQILVVTSLEFEPSLNLLRL